MAKTEGNSEIGSFAELGNVKANTVQKPKNLPDGHYSVLINGPFKEHKAKSGNLAMRFPLKIVQAMSDVDQEALQDEQVQKALQRDYFVDFWMSPDARWRFTDFGKAMGLSDELDILTMGEELVKLGEPFLMQGKNEQSDRDPEQFFFRLDNPAPLSTYVEPS